MTPAVRSPRRQVGTAGLAAAACLVSIALVASACSSSRSPSGTSGTTSSSGSSGGASAAPDSRNPIYFGAVLSLTGAYAAIEKPNLQGLQAGVDMINRSGGVLGRQVRLVYEDDQSDPAKVGPALQQLLSSYQVSFLEAEVIPNLQQELLTYTDQKKIISIEPTSGPGLFDPTRHPYNFEAYPASGQAQATVAAVKELSGGAGPKVAILNDGNTANAALAKQEADGVAALGGTVVYSAQINPKATDATPQVALAQHDGATVVVVQTGSGPCSAVGQAVATQNWKVKVLTSPACVNSTTMEAIPAAIRSSWFAIGQRSYLQDSGTGGPGPQLQPLLPTLEKYGTITDIFISTSTAYITNLMAYAIKQAGTTDAAQVVKVLEGYGNVTLPTSILFGLPNPKWSPAVHSFDNADLSSFWALLNPGTPKDGTYQGTTLTVPSNTPT